MNIIHSLEDFCLWDCDSKSIIKMRYWVKMQSVSYEYYLLIWWNSEPMSAKLYVPLTTSPTSVIKEDKETTD